MTAALAHPLTCVSIALYVAKLFCCRADNTTHRIVVMGSFIVGITCSVLALLLLTVWNSGIKKDLHLEITKDIKSKW